MRYTARVHRTFSGFAAQCLEIDALGEGSTKEAALRSLRSELEDRLTHVEGMAPPDVPADITIDLVVAEDEKAERAEPQGPGEAIVSE